MGTLDSLMDKYGDDLNSLVEKFRSSGLGEKFESWISTGRNEEITKDEVMRGLGQDEIDRIAHESGKTSNQVADELSRELPRAVDEATPTGQIPAAAGRPTV